MATVESLKLRSEQIGALYHEKAAFVGEVQQRALDEVLPLLEEELELMEEGKETVKAFIADQVTVFRFCRRSRFSTTTALKLLHTTLHWRLTTLATTTLSPHYLQTPLFFFHPSLFDKFGRPCAVLNLKHVSRTADGELDALKEFARVGWEMGRRWLSELSAAKEGEEKKEVIQMVLIVDLESAGMSNLEIELLPFFMDLLKSHFPGMVGAIFVLNYGWSFAGMWAVAKRVLPNTALERILFPTKQELLQFFEEDHLLVEHGGTVSYTYTPHNPILTKFTPTSLPPSLAASPIPSRATSSDSLSTQTFQSAPGTPRGILSRRTSGLSMTSMASGAGPSHGLRTNPNVKGKEVRRVSSFRDLQERLEETQRAIGSDDSEDGEYEEGDDVEEETEGDVTGDSDFGESGGESGRTSGVSSMSVSREASPRRKGPDGEVFSSRAVRFSGRNHISPYNHSNPFYGYPAFVPDSHLDPSGVGVPRPHYHRRRKRDLVRTLTYLAVLRFLALHRNIKWRLSVIMDAVLRILRLKKADIKKERGRVHFDESSSSGGKKAARTWTRWRKVDVRLVYLLLAIILFKTETVMKLVRMVLVDVPVALVPKGVKDQGKRVAERLATALDSLRCSANTLPTTIPSGTIDPSLEKPLAPTFAKELTPKLLSLLFELTWSEDFVSASDIRRGSPGVGTIVELLERGFEVAKKGEKEGLEEYDELIRCWIERFGNACLERASAALRDACEAKKEEPGTADIEPNVPLEHPPDSPSHDRRRSPTGFAPSEIDEAEEEEEEEKEPETVVPRELRPRNPQPDYAGLAGCAKVKLKSEKKRPRGGDGGAGGHDGVLQTFFPGQAVLCSYDGDGVWPALVLNPEGWQGAWWSNMIEGVSEPDTYLVKSIPIGGDWVWKHARQLRPLLPTSVATPHPQDANNTFLCEQGMQIARDPNRLAIWATRTTGFEEEKKQVEEEECRRKMLAQAQFAEAQAGGRA
ncbi:major sperm protein [Pseudohyphozyma bogoriensis]|nr:major sperm protein [Pseudohyphozyma bogoriensis]